MKFVRAIAVQGSDHDYEVRIVALENLGECLDELENLLRLAMHDRDELVRTTALEIAGDASLTHLADEVVRRFTSDRSPLVRSAAAVALGDMCVTNFRELLEEKLGDPDEEVRVGIYYALVKSGATKYLKRFLNGLKHPYYRIRCATANLLPSLVRRDNRALAERALKEALKRETTVAARESIEGALAEIEPTRRRSANNLARRM
jgi:HEAT repeat protein